MPGFCLYHNPEPITENTRTVLRQAAESMRINDRYETSTPYSSSHLCLYFTAYEEYPRQLWDDADFLILLEGCVYSHSPSQLQTELQQLARLLVGPAEKLVAAAGRWQWQADGEFVAILINKKTDSFCVITDNQGLLPLFRYQQDRRLYLARELKFIATAANWQILNRLAIAERLAYGVSLADKTHYRDIEQVKPASVAYLTSADHSVRFVSVSRWNWGKGIDPTTGVAEYADGLAEALLAGTRARLERTTGLYPLLALSGGLDSRAVLTSLRRQEARFSAYTCLNHERINAADARVARQLVEVLDCDWRLYELPPTRLEDIIDIVVHQEGATDTIMAAGMGGFERLRDEFGDACLIVTGDGGIQLQRPQESSLPLRTNEDIYNETVGKLSIFDCSTVERLLRMRPGELKEAAIASLSSYPGSDLKSKRAHFFFVDRPRQLVWSGQDRTRFRYWLFAPLLTSDLVKLVSKVPGTYKRDIQLYRLFLKRLDERALAVPYANIGARLGSLRAKGYSWLKGVAHRHPRLFNLARRVSTRRRFQSYSHPQLDSFLLANSDHSQLLAEYFDMDFLRRLYATKLTRQRYFKLATTVLSVLLLENGFSLSRLLAKNRPGVK